MRKVFVPLIRSLIMLALFIKGPASAQMGFKIELPKPEEYEERVLRSEKTKEGKLRLPGKVVQNTVTHFNYTYNATRKLNDVLQKAKEVHRDDYATLLPFYNYSLSVTRKDSLELDSVIQKASSGIALHDLRNDWTDDLYLLWGIAYHLQEKFDSAHLLFQFINYYYAPREKDGYFKTIGSARDGNKATSIATTEKKGVFAGDPAKRNDALIWEIRNYLAQEQFAQAAGLLQALRVDATFPARLRTDLNEVISLSFYKQQKWDSAAFYLAKMLTGIPNTNEKARLEYLTGQLYELAGNNGAAKLFYTKAIPHSTDLILEIQSRIAAIRVDRSSSGENNQSNIVNLLNMAEKEKYSAYRDIILYAAAQMDLAIGNKERAAQSLLASTTGTANSTLQRNKAFLQLAELSYSMGAYALAHQYYDSLKSTDSLSLDPATIASRKDALKKLVSPMGVIYRQDSLLRIAGLPEEERKEFVRKLVKQLRKQAGLQDDPQLSAVVKTNPSPVVNSLFGNESEKGEWYFYNASSRTRGQASFVARWGNRPNVDNWRRSATIQSNLANLQMGTKDSASSKVDQANQGVDFDLLYTGIPLSEEKKKIAADSLANALLETGRILIQEIEDCSSGITQLKRLLDNYSKFEKSDEALFYLYECAAKSNNQLEEKRLIKKLQEEFPNSLYTKLLTSTSQKDLKKYNPVGDSIYTVIYSSFVAGDYPKAFTLKKEADKTFGDSLWTPQLLFIEAAYHVQNRNDSTAIRLLRELQIRFSDSPLFERAAFLLEAIAKRKQLEQKDPIPTAPTPPSAKAPSTNPSANAEVKPDSTQSSSPYKHQEENQHWIIFAMENTEPVLAAEAMRAIERYNRETFFNRSFTTQLVNLDARYRLITIGPFGNFREALAYIERVKPKTATELVPWMSPGKYEWLPISTENLSILKDRKELGDYRSFINTKRP